MGFASYLEDNIERVNERIHLAQSRLKAQRRKGASGEVVP